MRILFVSGESSGGAPRSTCELAEVLASRGHQVQVVLGQRPSKSSVLGIANRVLSKWEGHRGSLLARRAYRRLGARTLSSGAPDFSVNVRIVRLPENGYLEVLRNAAPDIVVVNSVPRMALRWIQEDLRSRSIPLALYLRESHALTHLTISRIQPDLAMANTTPLADLARELGVQCHLVPSAIDCSQIEVDSTRQAVLMVNPVAENHLDVVDGLSSARPLIPFVLQESWPLSHAERTALFHRFSTHKNVVIRPATANRGEIYRDARVLLATYPSGRPRVVVEAQHNGIPCVGLDQPALAEAVGAAGTLLPQSADLADWLSALDAMWEDPEKYASLREICFRQAADSPTKPDRVASAFERAVGEIVPR